MSRLIGFLFLSLGISVCAPANFIVADFRTTKGNFSAELDFRNSPLAVANFIMLAGKPDDILETLSGVPTLGAQGHNLQLYRATAESDVARLPLSVRLVPETSEFRAYYGIYQNTALIGGVETATSGGFYRDITGEDRIRLQTLSFNPPKYRIILRYPRPWLDARDLTVKEAPMYQNMPIRRVETGRRFFAGTMTNNRFEHPGYQFQDEVTRNPGATLNPFGEPFNTIGVLAMDNVQRSNQNGSSFFITGRQEPTLNGLSTAFGKVLNPENPNVLPDAVQRLVNASTDVFNEPDEFILLVDIKIRREGVEALGFLEGFQNQRLPGKIEPLAYDIERREEGLFLVSELRPQTLNAIYSSPDLVNFSGGFMEGQSPIAVSGLATNLNVVVANIPRTFYKGFSAELREWPSGELDLTNQWLQFTLSPSEGRGLLNLYFGTPVQNNDDEDDGLVRIGGTYGINMEVFQNQPDGGTVVMPSLGTGTFFATYDFERTPFEGRFVFSNVTGPLNVRNLTLSFESLRSGANRLASPSARLRKFRAVSGDSELPSLGYSGVFQVR